MISFIYPDALAVIGYKASNEPDLYPYLYLFYPDALAVIGYKGECKPDWVTDVKTIYDSTSRKGDVAIARVSLPTRPVCDG